MQGDQRAEDLDHAARLEATLAEVEALDPAVRSRVQALVDSLLGMYGDGLARIVRGVADAGPAADPLRRLMVEDEVVASLLLIHDLHPVALRERVEAALGRVRPYVESHGGSVALVGLEDGVARIELSGTCESCPSSQATLDGLVRGALEAEAPDLVDVEWQGARPQDLLQIGSTPGGR